MVGYVKIQKLEKAYLAQKPTSSSVGKQET